MNIININYMVPSDLSEPLSLTSLPTQTRFSICDSKMHELLIIGAGPHALSLISTLLERRPDRYLEHPDNGLLFYRTRVDAGDNTRTSHRIHARHYHEDAAKGKDKHEREKVQKVLNGAGKTGARLNDGKRCTHLWEDGHVDIRVRDPSGLRLANASGAASLAGGPPSQWLLDHMLILDKMSDTATDERLGSWMPSWKKQMDFLVRQRKIHENTPSTTWLIISPLAGTAPPFTSQPPSRPFRRHDTLAVRRPAIPRKEERRPPRPIPATTRQILHRPFHPPIYRYLLGLLRKSNN